MEIINTTVKQPIQGATVPTRKQKKKVHRHPIQSSLTRRSHLHASCHSCLVNRHQFHLGRLNNAGGLLRRTAEGWNPIYSIQTRAAAVIHKVASVQFASCSISNDGNSRFDLITAYTVR